VQYGDASRLELLRAAGAAQAKLLVVAIDDRERALEIVETAKHAFPQLIILARAWDRRAAYDLLEHGADAVERESFEGSLALGRVALERLGLRAHQAHRAAALFRRQDKRLFEKLRPLRGDDEGFILASRQSAMTFETLMMAERAGPQATDADLGWDTASLKKEKEAQDGD
jgi:voltage-gated potassium channel Kch